MSRSVSVIIPTFNRCGLLARAIDSALTQTHCELEVIVVDDGSTDGTADMLRARYGAEKRLKIIHQENQGVCVARNRALDAAQGQFIAFLDSDDVWRPWKLEVQLACLTRRPEAGMVWTDMEAVGPCGKVVHSHYLRKMYSTYHWFPDECLFEGVETLSDIMAACPDGLEGTLVNWGRIGRAMIIGNLVHTSTVLLSRMRLEQVGRFDESLAPAGEDHDFHLRVCEAGPVALIDAPSIYYQTGLADRLTRHREVMARHYLVTMERAVARVSASNRPPRQMLRKARARGHAWLASSLLEQGNSAAARKHLLYSLSCDPFQPRQLAELVATSMPKSLNEATRAVLSKTRRASRLQAASTRAG